MNTIEEKKDKPPDKPTDYFKIVQSQTQNTIARNAGLLKGRP